MENIFHIYEKRFTEEGVWNLILYYWKTFSVIDFCIMKNIFR